MASVCFELPHEGLQFRISICLSTHVLHDQSFSISAHYYAAQYFKYTEHKPLNYLVLLRFLLVQMVQMVRALRALLQIRRFLACRPRHVLLRVHAHQPVQPLHGHLRDRRVQRDREIRPDQPLLGDHALRQVQQVQQVLGRTNQICRYLKKKTNFFFFNADIQPERHLGTLLL